MESDSNTWTAHHLIYNQNATDSPAGNCFYSLVLVNHNTTTNTTNWIYSSFSATFTLAPNIFVIDKMTSTYGGLFVNN